MVGKDIIGHEITHGVNYQLLYAFQSGALSESLSDTMAVGLDRNWTLGEGTIVGIIRYMDDPPRSPRPQPDRLFSDLYRCAEISDESTDNGYVHFNSGGNRYGESFGNNLSLYDNLHHSNRKF